VFDASERPLARVARYRVRVTKGVGTPDVPPADPVVLQPARIVVVHGASAAKRRAAAEAAVADTPVAHVDVGAVESAWIGETEKSLAAAMDAAAASGAVLMFDEADAMFAKRTDVAALTAAGGTVVVTTADARVVRRLAAQGAEVVDASET
jgi:SpoVK/Ycf46/Vps4 family AAA+-type ATPase